MAGRPSATANARGPGGALLSELAARPPEHGLVKLQVTGPATLAYALERAAPPRREPLALAREIAVWLAANVAQQIRALTERELDALLVVDEPGLHQFPAERLDAIWDPLRAVAPAWGLHLCGPVPWGTVERAAPDVLSFDLARAALAEPAVATLRGLDARGGRIAWGVVQPHRPEHAGHAIERLRHAVDVTGIRGEHHLLTASCGSGRMSKRREDEIATALRVTAGGPGARRAAPDRAP